MKFFRSSMICGTISFVTVVCGCVSVRLVIIGLVVIVRSKGSPCGLGSLSHMTLEFFFPIDLV